MPACLRTNDSGHYLTSTTAMELDELPASLLVLGGGYVAMEMAQLFAHLGTEVTVLVRSQLARREEPEVAECIHDAFVADGIAVVEGAQPTEVRRHGDQVVVLTHDGEFRAEQLLVATGRQPRTAGLGLETVGVDLGPDGIRERRPRKRKGRHEASAKPGGSAATRRCSTYSPSALSALPAALRGLDDVPGIASGSEKSPEKSRRSTHEPRATHETGH